LQEIKRMIDQIYDLFEQVFYDKGFAEDFVLKQVSINQRDQ
jgi:hypothetical protein